MSESTTEAAAETSGDSSETTTEAAATETTETAAPTEVRDPEKLLSAYEAEKAKRKEQDSAIRDLRSELDAIKAKAEGKEAEFAAAQEAQRVKDEALAAANSKILRAEMRGAAKGVLADPEDAFRYIDLDAFEVGDNGEVDGDAIKAALDGLIGSKPYLAVQDGKRFQGSADGGARNEASKSIDDQIEDARKAGDHLRVISLKRQKAYADKN